MVYYTTAIDSSSKGIPRGEPPTALSKNLTKAALPDMKTLAYATTILR
jgi:hypothetical protein